VLRSFIFLFLKHLWALLDRTADTDFNSVERQMDERETDFEKTSSSLKGRNNGKSPSPP
jgi:hypothetical protein